MSKSSKKCKHCKGKGVIINNNFSKQCNICEGSGIQLYSEIEEQFEDAAEFDGTITHADDITFIEFEEDDYEY